MNPWRDELEWQLDALLAEALGKVTRRQVDQLRGQAGHAAQLAPTVQRDFFQGDGDFGDCELEGGRKRGFRGPCDEQLLAAWLVHTVLQGSQPAADDERYRAQASKQSGQACRAVSASTAPI
jgi:hypothetical protein